MVRSDRGIGVRARSPDAERDLVECYTDSDWAGDRRNRKSTSAMAIFVNSVFLMSASRTQKALSLSSCEAEYTAMVGGAADMLYVGAAVEFLSNTQPSLHLFCDSSSARQLAARRGCGKIRHLQLKLLWLQEKLASGAFQLHPVPTKDNLSDLQTKSLKAERQQFLLYHYGMIDESNGGKAIGENLVSYEDEKRSIQLAVKAIRNVGRSQSGMSSILRVLTLLATIESAGAVSALGLVTCDRADSVLPGLFLVFLICAFFTAWSNVKGCILIAACFSVLTAQGCDTEQPEYADQIVRQGFRVGWVFSLEVDWCHHWVTAVPGLPVSGLAVGLSTIVVLAVGLSAIGGCLPDRQHSVTRAPTVLERPSCNDPETFEEEYLSCDETSDEDRDPSETAESDRPVSAQSDDGWQWQDYLDWLANLDPEEYRQIHALSEPDSELAMHDAILDVVPDDGATAAPSAGPAEPEGPLVYIARPRGRSLHIHAECSALRKSRTIITCTLVEARQRFPFYAWCQLCT